MNKLSLVLVLKAFISVSAWAGPITPVCERTPPLVKELEKILEKPCAEMTADDLLEVDGIFLDPVRNNQGGTEGRGIKEFKAGDFSGLDNLMMLNVDGNLLSLEQLMTLKELPNLRFLSATVSLVETIPAGAFDDFTKLEELRIGSPSLKMIEPYAFSKMPSIRTVDVSTTASLATTSKAAFFGVEVTGLPGDFAVDPSRTKWK